MSKTYHCNIEVRGYELDSYAHLNHAMYISYLEHARWKLLQEEGITLATLNEWKKWPVIAGLEAKYIKPVYMGEVVDVRSEVVELRRVGFNVVQKMYRGETLVFEAKINAVMVNDKGRPTELPPQMTAIWGSA